jgi:replication-associated recombination protein RarA
MLRTVIISCSQDIFLPHVESGAITLIGATTENPSFSLNSALLSRCQVIVLEKLNTEHIIAILERTLTVIGGKIVKAGENINFTKHGDKLPR